MVNFYFEYNYRMVFLEVISSLQLVVSIGIFVLLFALMGAIADDEYKPQPMSDTAKRMYS